MKNPKINYFFLILCLIFSGCRVVPIQMARTVQIETYEQIYSIDNEQQASEVLENLVGEKNWEILIDYFGSKEYFQELQNKQIMIKGHVITTLSLLPTDHDTFFVEGFGTYYVIRKTTNELLFSSDYRVIRKEYSLKNLTKSKILKIDVEQFLVRHFPMQGTKNYFHDTPFSFQMHMKSVMDGVYTLDYSRPHDLIVAGKSAGQLYFAKSLYGKKLIDLRGIDMLRDDYNVKEKNNEN